MQIILLLGLLYSQVHLNILFLNDKDKIEDDFTIKEIYKEARSLIKKDFKRIRFKFMGILNFTKKSIFSEFKSRKKGEDLKIKKLKYLSDFFEKVLKDKKLIKDYGIKKGHTQNVIKKGNINKKGDPINFLIKKSTLIIHLTKRDNDQIEGLTFIGGNGSKRDKFSLIGLSKEDPLHYKGKVVAHEILHSLGAQHSGHSLMAEKFEESKEENRINLDTIREVEEFLNNFIKEEGESIRG
jgi:hypothetical protein